MTVNFETPIGELRQLAHNYAKQSRKHSRIFIGQPSGALVFKTSKEAITAAMCFTLPGESTVVVSGGGKYYLVYASDEKVMTCQGCELLFTYENCTDDAPIHAPQSKWKG